MDEDRRTRLAKVLLREQEVFRHLERGIAEVMARMDDNINALKVEELQLQSNAVSSSSGEVDDIGDTKQPQDMTIRTEERQSFIDNPDDVNQQELDLEVILADINDENED